MTILLYFSCKCKQCSSAVYLGSMAVENMEEKGISRCTVQYKKFVHDLYSCVL